MRILITGASGLIGQRAALALFERGHELTVLARNSRTVPSKLGLPCRTFDWDAAGGTPPPREAFEGVQAVLNLAGEPIGTGRWSALKKNRIYDSRVKGSAALVRALAQLPESARPKVFVSASAVGIYGDCGDDILREDTAIAVREGDFLAKVSRDWEKQTIGHGIHGIRSVALRFGVVLASRGGALDQLLPIFKLGIGGPVGSGRQWMSWVHVDDVVQAIIFAFAETGLRGPVNVTTPHPVTNREFAKALGRAISRPSFLKVPKFVLKSVLGEKSVIVLSSQRVLPERLVENGFQFSFERLEDALQDVCGGNRFEAVQWIPRKSDEVFAFFSDERNLERITPPWLGFHVVGKSDHALRPGTLINYRLRLRGMPMRWTSRIDQWEPGRKFRDVQVKGPYRLWEHEHTFIPVSGGTLIKDRVHFKVPLGSVGDAVAGKFVERDVSRIFAYRKKAIQDLFGKS